MDLPAIAGATCFEANSPETKAENNHATWRCEAFIDIPDRKWLRLLPTRRKTENTFCANFHGGTHQRGNQFSKLRHWTWRLRILKRRKVRQASDLIPWWLKEPWVTPKKAYILLKVAILSKQKSQTFQTILKFSEETLKHSCNNPNKYINIIIDINPKIQNIQKSLQNPNKIKANQK